MGLQCLPVCLVVLWFGCDRAAAKPPVSEAPVVVQRAVPPRACRLFVSGECKTTIDPFTILIDRYLNINEVWP